ncbi:hypothetical protein [Parvularcula sp. IMCC14364]|uniref:hypothetical protein n=1 Tax=Parvularcula sp. IMCC14364 TaxID=3067902 RepID=UPI0027403641|nr:hypothetical protein [Parvularcula sp. IMCC14364]
MASVLKRVFDLFFIVLIGLVLLWAAYNFMSGGETNAQADSEAAPAALTLNQQ